MFCWNDLRTSDFRAASKFYQGLFHWQYRESNTTDNRDYRIARLEEKDRAGIYSLLPETVTSGVTPHWLPYVSVPDARRTLEKARSLGAQIVKEPLEVGDDGTLAVLRDPFGALLGLWQPKTYGGSEYSAQPGTALWNEYVTPDRDAAEHFFTALFGWKAEHQKFGKLDYTVLRADGDAVGGLMKPTPDWGAVRPHWITYFSVQDCAASTALARKLGAEILAEPMEIQNVGRVSILRDPQGAVFGIIQPKMAREEAA